MSFQQLTKDQLLDVADFFVVDVEAASAEKGPSKKEVLAALASGDEPVTWEQYNEIYLPANEKAKPAEKDIPVEEAAPAAPVDTSDFVLVKFEGKNPSYHIGPYVFTKTHPFVAVAPAHAEHLIKNLKGFRIALPSEAADYYN